ncbi:RNA-guided endonuclease TnpB family protein [Cetobacterium sp. 2G large]|uniref:RNA-guided endonuclease TnpB family protein n=1 Tax=Cetobacterium sp. 2G large TaxID=2759680 RepID=UPI00163C631A|nr:RNA-guided endonuclease TnpB family protein [Cetobacterium sp. 2G large]MBC2852449.1 IS200/IS605 family element transposase accessory protein TnpB [Cetobacterium sp. 2G large]
MEKYNLAFRFRIYPNEVQTNLILQTFGCTRFVYNKILAKADEIYKLEGKSKIITPASLKTEFQFLKEVDSLALANAQMNVKTAFTNFFQKRTDFPKFKSKKTARKSYSTNSVNNSIRIEDNSIKLPKLGLVKIKLHRSIPQNYKIKSATISQEPNGAFYVSILTEFEKDIKEVPSDNNIVGLDFSMKELFVSSDNQRADYPRFFRKLETKLAKAQRELSRKVKFSSNWNKAKLKVAKIHQSIKNSRKDFLHKLSKELVTKYNAIIIEDLNMKGMSGALNFGKSVADNGWRMFTTMLQYKAMFLGKQVIKIDKWFPSSKTCSCCGNIKDSLSLGERVYNCECGHTMDRDLNASINIREVGRTLLAY